MQFIKKLLANRRQQREIKEKLEALTDQAFLARYENRKRFVYGNARIPAHGQM